MIGFKGLVRITLLSSIFKKCGTNAGPWNKSMKSMIFLTSVRTCRTICTSCFLYANYLSEVQKVKKLDKKLVELKDEDLVQYQVKGSGKGGQKTNKTANCVVLRHEPTGLSVRVHDSRSVLDNEEIAHARLRLKVDVHLRGEDSVLVQEEKRKFAIKQHKKIQAEKRMEGKARLKMLLENDDDDIKY